MVTKPHTDLTDLTNFSFDDVKSHRGFTTASLQRLTQIPQISRFFSFDGVKSHGGFTTASLQSLTQISQISRIFLLMMLNLTELGRKVLGRVGVLRVLRFPKLTQIQRDSTKIIRENLC